MKIVSRNYDKTEDFSRVMMFLRETFTETGSLHNWLPPRFEGSSDDMASGTRIWEEVDGLSPRIVAMANPESEYVYFIQIHPDYSYLEGEIIDWIIEHCDSKRPANKTHRISIVALEDNPTREASLKERGFERGPIYGILRVRPINVPIPDYPLPDGYSIRAVKPEDFEEIAAAIRKVFGHGESFTGSTLEKTAEASFYLRDLDLVVVAPDGSIVSFCTFRVDPESRITELEPMGTLPEYRRKGLAKALLVEGFRRLNEYNPTLLYIGGAADTPEANRLYTVTGFNERYDYYYWYKTIE